MPSGTLEPLTWALVLAPMLIFPLFAWVYAPVVLHDLKGLFTDE